LARNNQQSLGQNLTAHVAFANVGVVGKGLKQSKSHAVGVGKVQVAEWLGGKRIGIMPRHQRYLAQTIARSNELQQRKVDTASKQNGKSQRKRSNVGVVAQTSSNCKTVVAQQVGSIHAGQFGIVFMQWHPTVVQFLFHLGGILWRETIHVGRLLGNGARIIALLCKRMVASRATKRWNLSFVGACHTRLEAMRCGASSNENALW
jgi:hypothetical protein